MASNDCPDDANSAILPPDMPPLSLADVPAAIELPSGESTPTETPDGEITDQTLVAAVNEVLNSIGIAYDEIQSEVNFGIQTRLSDCLAPVVECEGLVCGSISRKLDQIENAYAHAYKSVLKRINGCLCECGAHLSECGVVYPSSQQVAYGLQTGDYLGSVGLSDLAQRVVADAVSPILSPPVTSDQPVVEQLPAMPGAGPDNPITTAILTLLELAANGSLTPDVIIRNVPAEYYPLVSKYLPALAPKTEPERKIEYFPLPTFTESVGDIRPDEKPKEPATIETPQATRKITVIGEDTAPVRRVPDWQHARVCRALEQVEAGGSVDQIFGFYVNAKGERVAPNWWYAAWNGEYYDGWSWLKKHAESALWAIIHGGKDLVKATIGELKDVFRCRDIPVDAMLANVLAGFVSQWTHGSLDGIVKGFEYKLNEACPQQIPSQAELNACYLRGQMDDTQWECLTRANNNLPALARKVLYSDREQIGYRDALMLFRLGAIDQQTYFRWANANGVITEEDFKTLELAAQDIPSVSDLIRMMVRDVEDEGVVGPQWLDFDFEKKWTGQLAKFGDAQGVNPEIARRHWRAHWDYPSATQAFEMLHRLRPGSDEVKRINAKLREAGVDPRISDVTVTEKMVFDLLGINDLAPTWRHRLTAISYRPLTRTDAKRAYRIGALGKNEEEQKRVLQGIFQDEGYTEENAKILVEFTDKEDKQIKARQSLPRQLNKWIKLYKEFLIPDAELQFQIKRYITDENRRDEVFKEVQAERDYIILKNKVICTRNAYMRGVLDDVDAKNQLVKDGIGLDEAIALVDSYWCKKKGAKQQVTAAQLCKWRELGLLKADDHFRRLVNLGYNVADAEKIVGQCEIDVTKKAMAAAKKEAAAKERFVRDRQKAADRAAKAAEKAGKLAAKGTGKDGGQAT